MANRSFKRGSAGPQTLDTAATLVRCTIAITAAGAVVATSGGPEVLSVIHTATGVYTINLKDTFPAGALAVIPTVLQGTATQAQATAQHVSCVSTSGSTIVLNTVLFSAPTTLADPASGITIMVLAYFNNTTLPF